MQIRMMRQVPTNPPKEVLHLDAHKALGRFKPQVVIGSWITRRFIDGVDREGESQANIYGVLEQEILCSVETYIHIGNDLIHGQKTLLQYEHETHYFDWIVSRSGNQKSNCIYVWHNREGGAF
jgi:hypothetical protein